MMSKAKNKKSPVNATSFVRRLRLWVMLAFMVFAAGLIVGYFQTRQDDSAPVAVEEVKPQALREVLLYFASPDGLTLVAESATINDCEQDEDCMRETVQALIAGPKSDLVAVLPGQTMLLGVTVADSLITLDFSHDLVAAHPGGTQSELLTVYALADTLTVNYPHLRQLQIHVDGSPVETLKGHVDLRQPIYPDFSFVEEGAAPIGNLEGAPVDRQ